MRKRKSGQRKKYIAYLGFSLPSDFDVHHIDLNPMNDDVSNLVGMPRGIHRLLHRYLEELDNPPIAHNNMTLKKAISIYGENDGFTSEVAKRDLLLMQVKGINKSIKQYKKEQEKLRRFTLKANIHVHNKSK